MGSAISTDLPTPGVLIEACVDSVGGALAAERLGADRIELGAGLPLGGLTPSAGTMSLAGELLALPWHALILPRTGGFVLGEDDLEVMRRDITMARAARAGGVVLGALGEDRSIDSDALARLVGWSRPMSVTFHRAFDLVPDPIAALETLMTLGVDRVLTAGGAPRAIEGTALLGRLVARAGSTLTVLAGGGVRQDHVAELVRQTGVAEVHARDITGLRGALAGAGS